MLGPEELEKMNIEELTSQYRVLRNTIGNIIEPGRRKTYTVPEDGKLIESITEEQRELEMLLAGEKK